MFDGAGTGRKYIVGEYVFEKIGLDVGVGRHNYLADVKCRGYFLFKVSRCGVNGESRYLPRAALLR
jgi:hypothetical protein